MSATAPATVSATASAEMPFFLADTWWFGLTRRFPAGLFRATAQLRREQGFGAVQLVAGIPPEVGPQHPDAASDAGFPWTLHGDVNAAYLALARQRITELQELGLVTIVYGAWGPQLDWLGVPRMAAWWSALVDTLGDLDVIFCLTGEADLGIGRDGPRRRQLLARRRAGWSCVLEQLAARTSRPILVHITPEISGFDAVVDPRALAANTLQTGHDDSSRNRLWRAPLQALARDPSGRGVINLEPWYEGIRERFGAEDQLFAYWTGVLAGARAACYGAHGLWNAGDGVFLAHWGRQTLAQALALDTPRLLGASHAVMTAIRERHGTSGTTRVACDGERLLAIEWRCGGGAVSFVPDAALAALAPGGRCWLPLEARWCAQAPAAGPCVSVRDGDAGTAR